MNDFKINDFKQLKIIMKILRNLNFVLRIENEKDVAAPIVIIPEYLLQYSRIESRNDKTIQVNT